MSHYSPRRFSFVLLAALCLQGCITVPAGVKSQISSEGAHATSSRWLGPALVVQGVSYLPGSKATRRTGLHQHRCNPQDLVLRWDASIEIPDADVARACDQLFAAVNYVGAFSDHAVRPRLTIELYPPAVEVTRHSLAAGIAHHRLALAFAWRDLETSLPDVLDTVSHEVFHIQAVAAHLREPRPDEESVAYLAGACAQLTTLGAVALSPGGTLSAADGATPEMISSSEAGSRLTAELAAASGNRILGKDRPAGREFALRCEAELAAYFMGTLKQRVD